MRLEVIVKQAALQLVAAAGRCWGSCVTGATSCLVVTCCHSIVKLAIARCAVVSLAALAARFGS
jgi:hypothetical protein